MRYHGQRNTPGDRIGHGSPQQDISNFSQATLFVSSSLLTASCFLFALPQSAQAQEWDPYAPDKLIQFKTGVGMQLLDSPSDQNLADPDPRWLAEFAVQTTLFPFIIELAFLSSISVDLSAGAYYPLLQSPYGVLCAGGSIVLREVAAHVRKGEDSNIDMLATVGLSAFVEWLWTPGWLGLFAEVRQSFFIPTATQFVVGVEASPQLIHWIRD